MNVFLREQSIEEFLLKELNIQGLHLYGGFFGDGDIMDMGFWKEGEQSPFLWEVLVKKQSFLALYPELSL